jgi:hypothetical protein
MFRPSARLNSYTRPARQKGQALVYGIFMLIFGLAALFFMFNTGQMTAEKTKLVNTADAVAYSAAVMHARALNFDAYTNRALVANEMTIAQMVSVKSWIKYAEQHSQRVTPLNCTNYYSVPIAMALVRYEPLCYGLAWQLSQTFIQAADQVIDWAAQFVVVASDVAKVSLQASQVTMYATFLPARTRVMDQVADANYVNDGAVRVDPIPFRDDFMLFEGTGPVLSAYTGNDRGRMRDLELAASKKDDFMRDRTWSDSSPWPCLPAPPRANASHRATTTMLGFDGWKATDSASLTTQNWRLGGGWFPTFACRTLSSYNLGSGAQTARTHPTGSDWRTSGVPSFFELSTKALKYKPDHPDEKKRDLRLQFAIRLTRAKAEQRTSAGTSGIKPGGRLALFEGNQAKDMMTAVATSEVFFERIDGKKEYGSLFNPYWQAHLIGNTPEVRAAALALQEK